MPELLNVLQQEIRRRPNLLYGLSDVQHAVRQGLAECGFAVVDQRLVPLTRPAPGARPTEPTTSPDSFLDHAANVLQVVRQVILQGPPGTGKTYNAKRLAARLLEISVSAVDEEESKTAGEFDATRFREERDGNCWELVQFFVRGIQAKTVNGGISYEVVRRVLDRLVQHHRENATTVLIIDEINRANLAQVLGELIYALEYRGSPVQTPYEIEVKED
jgi:adenylate kinase family enzyme